MIAPSVCRIRRQGELRIAVRWVLSSRDDKPLIAARSPPVLRAPTPGSQATGVLPQPRIITLTRGKYGFGMNVSLDCRVDSYPPPPFEAFVGFVPSLPLLAHSQRILFLSVFLSVFLFPPRLHLCPELSEFFFFTVLHRPAQRNKMLVGSKIVAINGVAVATRDAILEQLHLSTQQSATVHFTVVEPVPEPAVGSAFAPHPEATTRLSSPAGSENPGDKACCLSPCLE